MPPEPPPPPAPVPGAPSPRRTRRPRATGRSVIVGERLSRTFITIGGLGTILAVGTIFVFLLTVVWPLFHDAPPGAGERVGSPDTPPAVAVGSDEYGLIVWSASADGLLTVRDRATGGLLERRPLAPEGRVTAFALGADPRESVIGFADGTLRLLSLSFRAEPLAADALPPALRGLEPGAVRIHEGGVAEILPTGDARVQRLTLTLEEPLAVSEAALTRVARSDRAGGYVLATLDAAGRAAVHAVEVKVNRFSKAKPRELRRRSAAVPFVGPASGAPPAHVLLPGAGDGVLLVWPDGRAERFDCRDPEAPAAAETLDLVPEPGATVTAVGWVLGRTTLIVGDSSGQASGWFRTKPEQATTVDRSLLERVHDLGRGTAAVTAVGASPRGRSLALGHGDGSLRCLYVTTGRPLGEARLLGSAPERVDALAYAPKADALLAACPGAVDRFPLPESHPEVGVQALFGRVWYEGFEKPEHVWQSTGGTDDFEPKLGLMPLVFGTLKATFYALLFGVPIALLAAVFTSEFLSSRLRVPLKSVIEMMASLPSVVLGFLAGIVVAPFVQNVVPVVLTTFLLLPTLLLLGAHLWQLLPQHVALRLSGLPRLTGLVAVFPVAVLLAALVAPAVERALFRGDLLGWLDHHVDEQELAAAGWRPPEGLEGEARKSLVAQAGGQAAGKRLEEGQAPLLTTEQTARLRRVHGQGAVGGWVYLLLPLGVGLVVLLMANVVNPWLRVRSGSWSRRRCAWVALGRLLAGAVVAVGVAWLLGTLLAQAGADPRGSFEHAHRGEGALLGTYVQRNALVVGFVMGFAIIPIIYTLAEDALSSVPQHLRLGSLAAGATPWQTATRIIIPTATSGLFSAVMIGLGRAVGETMIVLMATGNTSVMEWNWFNGFRTLAANTATEIPEADVGSTHYRVLFLSAFVLFGITFALNTLAETVRQRFRRRAFQL